MPRVTCSTAIRPPRVPNWCGWTICARRRRRYPARRPATAAKPRARPPRAVTRCTSSSSRKPPHARWRRRGRPDPRRAVQEGHRYLQPVGAGAPHLQHRRGRRAPVSCPMTRPRRRAWRTNSRWTRPARASKRRAQRARHPFRTAHRLARRSSILASMRIDFTKMHGLGNDFIVLDLPADDCLPTPRTMARTRRSSHRHRLRSGAGAAAAAARRHRRVLSRLQRRRRRGRAVRQRRALRRRAAASARSRQRRHADDGQHRRPAAARACWPTAAYRWTWACRISIRDHCRSMRRRGSATYTHQRRRRAASRSARCRSAIRTRCCASRRSRAPPVERIGRALQASAHFPRQVNVGFMQIIDAGHIRLRVYERGVGETLACGTGACAAVVVGRSSDCSAPMSRCVCRAAC